MHTLVFSVSLFFNNKQQKKSKVCFITAFVGVLHQQTARVAYKAQRAFTFLCVTKEKVTKPACR